MLNFSRQAYNEKVTDCHTLFRVLRFFEFGCFLGHPILDQEDYRGLPEPVEHCHCDSGHKKSDHGKEESSKCPEDEVSDLICTIEFHRDPISKMLSEW